MESVPATEDIHASLDEIVIALMAIDATITKTGPDTGIKDLRRKRKQREEEIRKLKMKVALQALRRTQ